MQKKAQNAPKEKLTDAQRTLVEENIGLAKRIAWKYCALCAQYGMDWNDVFSIACLGLMRAVRSFDPTKGKASSYLAYGCELAIRMELRRWRNESHSAFMTVSMQEVCGRDKQGHELHIEDTLASDEPTPEEAVLDSCLEEEVQSALERKTTPTQQRVLTLKMQGLTQNEIARTVGCCQAQVSRILSQIRRRVMEEIVS